MLSAILAGIAKAAGGAAKAGAAAVKGAAGAVAKAGAAIGEGVAQVAPQMGANITEGAKIAGQGIAQGAETAFQPMVQAAQTYLGQGAQGLAQAGPRAVNAPPIAYQAGQPIMPSTASLTRAPIAQTGMGGVTGGVQPMGTRDYLQKLFSMGGGGGGNSGPGQAQSTSAGGFAEGNPLGGISKMMEGDMMGGMGQLMSKAKLVPEGPTNDAPPVEWGTVQPFSPYALPRGPLAISSYALRRRGALGGY